MASYCFIGDSRFVGMKAAISTNENITFIAKTSEGNDYYNNNTSTIYNLDKNTVIVYELGVNDLNSSACIKNLNDLVSKGFKNVYFVTVTPVNEEKEKEYGYTRINSQIENYNSIVINNLPTGVKVIDSYNYLKSNGIDTTDGLHYTNDTYKKWFDQIFSSFSVSGGDFLTNTSTQNTNITSTETMAKAMAVGLLNTHVEGYYNSFTCSTGGNYPSMGFSQWEGSRGDELLKDLGLGQYAGKSNDTLIALGADKIIAAALNTEKGHQTQMNKAITDMKNVLSNIRNILPDLTNTKCALYIGIWSPTTYFGEATCRFLKKRIDPDKINSLEAVHAVFANDGYAQWALGYDQSVFNANHDGYNNRANITYKYCSGINDSNLDQVNLGTINSSSTSIAERWGNPLSSSYNAPASSNVELKSTPRHGKHADYVYKSPDKLYCEPVYPDYVSINKGIPEYALGAIIASEPANKLQINGNMCYEAKSKEAEYASLKAPAEKQKSTSIKLKGDKAVLTNHSSSGTTTVTAQQVSLEQLAHTIKEPSIGKPVNNNDPFPIDAKIEELELHKPRCKIDKIQTCPEAINVTKACIKLSMDVEKRIVRLENNMATILRYLARYAARVPMNCVYYGGQVPNGYEKYKCIRCLKDDRISDGQLMQFDQCLNCERYEPIIGQVYDILDDTAQNLSQVLDNCQMSYSNMNEYTKLSRSTMHQQKLSKGTLDKANINTRAADDKDFDWTEGQIVQWNTVPVEDQVPHINRIQNINGEELSNLSSCQTTATNAGSAFCSTGLSGLLGAKEEMDKVISGAIASQLVSATGNKEKI